MKIVYLIAGTFNAGGMERVLTNKVNWLVAHGHEVGIVTTDQRGREPYFPLDAKVQTIDLNINYDADNGRLMSKLLLFPVRQWRHRRRLERLLRQWRADVVVCMFNNDASFVHRIADGSRKVLEVHFSKNKKLQYGRKGLWRLADWWRTRKEERLVGRYDRFVVLTHEDRQLWGSLDNIMVIPNARTFEPSVRADMRSLRVLAVGRYDYQKGFDTLLNIYKKIADRATGWTLDIIGDGPLRLALQQQVAQLGLAGQVLLLPPTDDMKALYARSSIVAMTSRYEGLPMVLLEAQACGLPIVAFACQCGPRDVIHDGEDGFLIEGRDEALFAQRLLRLMGDEELRRRMSDRAAAHSESFSEEHIMQQWEQLFTSITQQ